MSERRTVVAQEFMEKGGETNGKAWTRYALKDANGDTYSTFTKDVIAPIQGLVGQKVDIEFEQKDKFKNLVSAAAHNGSMPETYSHQKPDGEADWDKVALGKTRCALWTSFLSSPLAASLYANAHDAAQDPFDLVIRVGTRLVVHAEKDTFERPPGDDGVPF